MLSTALYADMIEELNKMCYNIKQVVPVVALLMFITAGLVYAAGQIMGAETRSRANVWSTAMLVGGIIGLILAASAPYLVTVFANAALGGEGGLDVSPATCSAEATGP
ncbi:MAG: hypothetical protein AB1468_00475 [Candidatus Micrarchaeota archaeon]